MPRPRPTWHHRQALATVVSAPIAAAASSVPPSRTRSPARNGVVPSRHSSTATMPSPPTRRAHAQHVFLTRTPPRPSLPSLRATGRNGSFGQGQQVGVLHHGSRQVGEPAREVGLRVQAGALLAGGTDPAAQPLGGEGGGVVRPEPPRRGPHVYGRAEPL